MVNLIIFGVVFSLFALFTEDLWLVCGMHFSWNYTLGCIIGNNVSGIYLPSIFTFKLNGDDILTGGAFGIEGSILTTLTGVIISAVILLLLYKRAEIQRLKEFEEKVFPPLL